MIAQRAFSGVIAGVTLLSLGAQFIVSMRLMGNPGTAGVVWQMVGYFTVLTNTLVLFTFAASTCGMRANVRWQAALTLWIGMVGVVYHAVLAGVWTPVGLGWWADQGLHTAVPLLVLAFWILAAAKAPLGRGDLAFFLTWPVFYLVYALIRGGLTGFYAYPFIDLPQIGGAELILNMIVMLGGFFAAGMALIWLAERFNRGDWRDR